MKKPWSPGMELSPAEAAAHASRLITSMSAASAEFAKLWAERLEEMEGEVLLFSLFGDLARVLMALDLRGSYARNEFEAIAYCLEQELAHVSVRDDSDPWKDYIGTVLVTGLFEAFGDEPGVLDRLATGGDTATSFGGRELAVGPVWSSRVGAPGCVQPPAGDTMRATGLPRRGRRPLLVSRHGGKVQFHCHENQRRKAGLKWAGLPDPPGLQAWVPWRTTIEPRLAKD